MRGNFEQSLKVTLPFEGGYVNHPRDPGGPTNKGVTQKTLSAYLGRKATVKDVKEISDAIVHKIYRDQYWNRIWGDRLPLGMDLAAFDYAVNSGVSQAIKTLQREVGVKPDGVMGMVTLDKIKEKAEVIGMPKLVENYCVARLIFLKKLRTWGTFGKGWQRRVMGKQLGVQLHDNGVIDYASHMAKKATMPAMPKLEASPQKGNVEDVRAAQLMETGPTAMVGGSVGEVINQASMSFMPYSEISTVVKVVCVGLIIVGAGITFWSVYRKYKKGELDL